MRKILIELEIDWEDSNDVCDEIMVEDAIQAKCEGVGWKLAAPQWVSVEERLPETEDNVYAVLDGETCILSYFSFTENGETFKVWGYVYDGVNGDGIYDDNYSPTHWMPLPNPPKETK